jgi:hypothetical protein
MQWTWIRALIFVAVSAVSVLMTGEAEAQGPVRRLFRRMLGRDNFVSANTTIDANGNRVLVRNGYTTTMTTSGRFDASGRWIGPVDRTARGGTRVDAQVAPATRIEADANVRAPGGANIRGRATGDAGVDVNRNDGTIRGNVEERARGGATTPSAAPRTIVPPNNSALPPPVSEAPVP